MKKSVMKKWVAALRSGEYKQGRYKLRSANDKFCCLGVLCNLHAQEHPEFAAKQSDKQLYGGDDSLPVDEVIKWAGFKPGNHAGQIPSVYCTLTNLNDTGKTFNEISDIIEEHYEEL
jgi:hypothetical protein